MRVMPRVLVSFLVLTVTGAGWAGPGTVTGVAAGTGSCAPSGQTAHLDQAYARTTSDPVLTAVDVYELDVPDGCAPAPILFWVHGGGWRNGDKTYEIASKRHLALEHGWTLISVNYRLVPEVVYPVPNQDVADAIGWTLDHSANYHADPDRVVIMGHSAGAGIVAAVATDERYLRSTGHDLSDLDCAVALDTEAYDITVRGGDGGIYDAMFGTDPSAWPDQSPLRHVALGKGIPDHFIVTRGGPARVGMARDYAGALTAAGVPVTLLEVDLTHAGVNSVVGDPTDTQVMPTLVPFLDRCAA